MTSGWFVCMNQTLCVCLTTPTQSNLFWFCLQVVRQAGPTQLETAWLSMENERKKRLSQGHYDAGPVRESNRE